VDEAVLTVKPHGLYLEYGLYLTFSHQGVYFSPNDSLEVTCDFELPEKAAVIDSWLWINEDIVRGKLLDLWTASTIYENTVKRRTDPSILTKTGGKTYNLKIFPLVAGSTRRVKLTYLVPLDWQERTVRAPIPGALLKAARVQPPALKILFFPREHWSVPTVSGSIGFPFLPLYHPVQGNYLQAEVPASAYGTSLYLSLPAPYNKGVYAEKHTLGDQQFFELAIQPNLFLNTWEPRRVCVLVDYQAGGQTPGAGSVMEQLRQALTQELSPDESFNLMVSSGFSVKKARSQWVPAHPDSIQKICQEMLPKLGNTSNLTGLLPAGLAFAQQQINPADVLLISNSTQFNNLSASIAAYYNTQALLQPLLPISVLDFNTATDYFYQDGLVFYGNEHYFRNICQFSGGDYYSTRNNPATLQDQLSLALQNLQNNLQAFDLHTGLDNGFCYGRYYLSDPPAQLRSLRKPLLQLGKYVGNFPMKVQMGGLLAGQPFFEEFHLEASDFPEGDSLVREMWVAQLLRDLEEGPIDNNQVLSAIQTSLSERVLSRYTAFLCLEDSTQFCYNCLDETTLTPTANVAGADTLLTAFPNPFSDQVTFRFQVSGAGAVLEVFRADGQVVFSDELTSDAAGTLVWRPGAALPAGPYLARLTSGSSSATVRVIKASGP
jgi:Ca-activated chloride channel family protein